jgi:hypothetical protein
MARSNNVRILRVTEGTLLVLLSEGPHNYTVLRNGIPNDVQILNSQYNFAFLTVDFLLESKDFSPVAPGEEIPVLNPVVFKVTNEPA